MNIFKLAWELLVVYIIYKLIFGFIVPLYRSAKNMRQQFNDLQSKMQQPQQGGTVNANEEGFKQSQAPVKEGEYIEYEEVNEKNQ
ncbi:MAG: hypothetical protein JSS98_08810 [Bacteroidetes bacterium]|nr:hypothetical protein [Bacteroidota bacterium]